MLGYAVFVKERIRRISLPELLIGLASPCLVFKLGLDFKYYFLLLAGGIAGALWLSFQSR